MRRLDRYVLQEIIGLLVLGFAVYTFILILQYLFTSAEMIIEQGLPLATVGRLLLLILPSSVVLTLPMSLLFAILIGVGRMAADSEIVALRASGVSLVALYRPILLLSAALALFNTYLMVEVLPAGNHALQRLQIEILTQSVAKQVEPRVFNEQWTGKVLYVFDVPEGQDRWKGVFLAQSRPGETNEVIVAEWGLARVGDDGERLELELEEAVTHTVDLRRPDAYNVIRHEKLSILLEDQFTSRQMAKISASKSIREMDLAELRQTREDPEASPELRNLARVQIHKTFSIPAASLVFGLLALPLGFNSRRGGKAAGFALSLAVILVYWVLLSNGEEAARFGRLEPWLAMWLPNVLFAAVGIVLLWRRNRDKGLLASRLDRWVRRDLWSVGQEISTWLRQRRQVRRQGGKAATQVPGNRVILRLPRIDWRFPSLLDRYVIRRFSTILLLVFVSGLVLYVVADLGENIDDILRHEVPRSVVLKYYKYLSLQIVYDISPIVVLVTTLLTFSILARANELTAFKALGVSLFRLALPAIAVTCLVVVGNVYLQSEVLPASNQKVAQLKNRIKGKDTARTYRRADRQWLFSQGGYIYNYLRYDPAERQLERLQVFEFDADYRLERRLFSSRARYAGDQGWTFDSGWKRSFREDGSSSFETFNQPRRSDYREDPEYFTSEIRPPAQMRYWELRRYIEELEGQGDKVPELRVQLQRKISYPAISLVMVLVGLPFAFRLGRQGALYGIGLAITLGIVFMAVFAFFTTLGSAGLLLPILAVWTPNLVFAFFALYLFLGVRT